MDKTASPRRPNHRTHRSIISDYDESDANYLSDVAAAAALPPPAERTDEQLNISVLQRHNPDVVSLEYVAPYAVVYVFSPEQQAWEKSGVEGTAFLCGLRPSARLARRFAVTVLNRRGLDNFQLELLAAGDVEITEEYVILQSSASTSSPSSSAEGVADGAGSSPAVYGLWVFSEPAPSSTAHHRANMALRIQQCAELVEQGRRGPGQEEELDGQGEAYNGHDADVEEEEDDEEMAVPMGRQLSLKELLGQQRQRDDAWSVRSHSPSRSASRRAQASQSPPQMPPAPAQPQFVTTADTDFFRGGSRSRAAPPSPAVSAESTGQRQKLLDLFRKAGDDYMGSL